MKIRVRLFVLACLVAVASYGQTARESVVFVQGYSSAATASANFPGGVFGERASIVPQRMMPYWDPWIGTYDRATYLVIRQATPYESGTSVSESSGLPAQSGSWGNCVVPPYVCGSWALSDYLVSDHYLTQAAAMVFYNALDSRQKATAYFLSTVATANRWIVVYQRLIEVSS